MSTLPLDFGSRYDDQIQNIGSQIWYQSKRLGSASQIRKCFLNEFCILDGFCFFLYVGDLVRLWSSNLKMVDDGVFLQLL
jgi:hypothetical protein